MQDRSRSCACPAGDPDTQEPTRTHQPRKKGCAKTLIVLPPAVQYNELMTRDRITAKLARPGMILLLAGLGLGGNLLHVQLFYNVDLIFGSVFSLIALFLYGLPTGLLVSATSASWTWVLWGHPWAMVILLGEVIFCDWAFRKKHLNIIHAVLAYWLFLGMPQVFFWYHLALGMHPDPALLVMLKQAFNAMLNALLASAVIIGLEFFPLTRGRGHYHRTLDLSFIIQVFLLAFLIFPSLSLIIIQTRERVSAIEQTISVRLEDAAYSLQQFISSRISLTRQRLQLVARKGALLGEQFIREELARLAGDDGENQIIAGVSAPGEHALCESCSQTAACLCLSEECGTAKCFDTVPARVLPAILVQINTNGRRFWATLSRSELVGWLVGQRERSGIRQALLFEKELTLEPRTDTWPTAPLAMLAGNAYAREQIGTNLVMAIPTGQFPSAMMRWGKSCIYTIRTLPDLPGLTLVAEAPLAPAIAGVVQSIKLILVILVSCIVLSTLVAWLIGRRIARSLTRLAEISKNIPARLEAGGPEPGWHGSAITEIQALISNFREMTMAMTKQVGRLRESS